MDRTKWDRWAPVTGTLFVALVVVTFFIPTASPPDTSDPAEKVVGFFTDHRSALLTSGYLTGLALIAFVWFLASLTTTLRDNGEPRLAAVAFGGGLVLTGYAVFATAVQTLLAFNLAKELDAGTVKALWEIEFTGFGFTFPLAIVAGATSIAALRSRILPQWFGALGIVGALWFLVGGATYARTGFFSPDGAYGFIGFLAFLVWVLLTSILLLQRGLAEEKTHQAAPMPA